MRAEHEAGHVRPVAFVPSADIADGIEMGAHAGLAHPPHDEVRGLAQLLAEEDAGELLGLFRDRAELVDPANDLIAERCIVNGTNAHLGELSIF